MDSPEEDLVLFNQTQPVDGKIIREFPKNSLGFYSRIGDSSSLIEIEPYIITSQSIFKSELNIPKEQTDSLSDFHNWSHDSIILHLKSNAHNLSYHGDTVFFDILFLDTVIDLNESVVVKKKRKDIFLNYPTEDTLYAVRKISFKMDTMFIGKIGPLNNTEFVEAYDSIEAETTEIKVMELNKRQSKKLFESDDLNVFQAYIKQKVTKPKLH